MKIRLLVILLMFNLSIGIVNAQSSLKKYLDDVSINLQRDVDKAIKTGTTQQFIEKHKGQDSDLENIVIALGFRVKADAFYNFCKFTDQTPHYLINKIKSFNADKKIKPYFFEKYKQTGLFSNKEIELIFEDMKKNILAIEEKLIKNEFIRFKTETPELTKANYCERYNEIADEYVQTHVIDTKIKHYELYRLIFVKQK